MSTPRLTPDQVRRALDLAAELDSAGGEIEGGDLAADELVEAGVEAGFSRAVMERVVEEVRRAPPPATQRPALFGRLLRDAGPGTVMAGFTALAQAMGLGGLALASFLAGIPFLLARAAVAGKERAHSSFQLTNLAYWGGYLLAMGLFDPGFAAWGVVAVPVYMTVLAVAGVVVVEGRWRIAKDGAGDG